MSPLMIESIAVSQLTEQRERAARLRLCRQARQRAAACTAALLHWPHPRAIQSGPGYTCRTPPEQLTGVPERTSTIVLGLKPL
jgi:hypothetical protein